jgi:hypothetical protein
VIFLVPAILAGIGLLTGRPALVLIALGGFLWLAWQRRSAERDKWRLRSVPMPAGVTVSDFTGANTSPPSTPESGPSCGCA